ncbi:MAG: phosphotransferase [Neisseriaceae bacterium]|nr:phosphotransferase [Neisseriaceae bacterium]
MPLHDQTSLLASLDELHDTWQTTTPTRFVYHAYLSAYVPSLCSPELQYYLGPSRYKVYTYYLKHLSLKLRGKCLDDITLDLPADTVLFYRERREGLIICSRHNQKILKLFPKEQGRPYLKNHIKTLYHLNLFTKPQSTPDLLSLGSTSTESIYLITSFTRHDIYGKRFVNQDKAVYQDLFSQLAPALADIYKTTTTGQLSLSGYLRKQQLLATQHPSQIKINALIMAVINDPAYDPHMPLLTSFIHGDADSRNFAKSQHGYVILDWEMQTYSLLHFDLFDLYTRYRKRKVFSDTLRLFFERYAQWQNTFFHIAPPSNAAYIFYLVYLIERIALAYHQDNHDVLNQFLSLEAKIYRRLKLKGLIHETPVARSVNYGDSSTLG